MVYCYILVHLYLSPVTSFIYLFHLSSKSLKNSDDHSMHSCKKNVKAWIIKVSLKQNQSQQIFHRFALKGNYFFMSGVTVCCWRNLFCSMVRQLTPWCQYLCHLVTKEPSRTDHWNIAVTITVKSSEFLYFFFLYIFQSFLLSFFFLVCLCVAWHSHKWKIRGFHRSVPHERVGMRKVRSERLFNFRPVSREDPLPFFMQLTRLFYLFIHFLTTSLLFWTREVLWMPLISWGNHVIAIWLHSSDKLTLHQRGSKDMRLAPCIYVGFENPLSQNPF